MNEQVVKWLNQASGDARLEAFLGCCGSRFWAKKMAAAAPFSDAAALRHAADLVFDAMPNSAWIEAFESHPRIGDIESIRMRYAGNKQWSAEEQSGAAEADEQTLAALAEGNQRYEERFGRTFIVCATGKSAGEMLALLETRIANEPADEFSTASIEQRKITALRMEKLGHTD